MRSYLKRPVVLPMWAFVLYGFVLIGVGRLMGDWSIWDLF